MKAREVVSLRLSDDERFALELAAKREGFSLSEFLRRAGLVTAHRLREAAKPKPPPVARPEPPLDDGRHFTRTYNSFQEYASRGSGIMPGPDTFAIADRLLKGIE